MRAKVMYIENPTEQLKLQIKTLYKLCFEDSDEYVDFFVNTKIKNSLAFFIFDDNEQSILSMFFVSIRHLRIFTEIHEMSFIFASATHPDFRGKGMLSNQMRFYIEKASKERIPFIFLHPFNHSFYQKYGFETIDFLYKTKFTEGDLQIRALKPTEILRIPSAFNEYCSGFDIAQFRTELDWSRKLEELVAGNGGIILLTNGEAVEGYFFVDDGKINEAVINSMPKVNDEKIIGYNFMSHTPSNTIIPNTQARIVDAESALRIFAKYQKVDFCLSLTDDIVDRNNAVFRIEGGNCVRLDNKYDEIEVDFELTINELSKYLFGAHKHDENDLLTKYFEPRAVAIFDEY